MEVLGPCVLAGTLHDHGDYPALALTPAGRVAGELCRIVSDDAWPLLDAWEDYRIEDEPGSEYLRVRVRLLEPDLKVWTYAFNRPPEALPVVPGGDWVAHVAARGAAPDAARWR